MVHYTCRPVTMRNSNIVLVASIVLFDAAAPPQFADSYNQSLDRPPRWMQMQMQMQMQTAVALHVDLRPTHTSVHAAIEYSCTDKFNSRAR